MKTLKQSIKEGLFDNLGLGITEENIKEWITMNFDVKNMKIKIIDNKFVVDAEYVEITNKNLNTLTNRHKFEWGYVDRFYCDYCNGLTNLEGAPKECNYFNCTGCMNLKTLEGAPEKCDGFSCVRCNSLRTLEGSPKLCNDLICGNCANLSSLKGALSKYKIFQCYGSQLIDLEYAPKECEEFSCNNCKKLKSLKGGPEKCKNFQCSYCSNLKTLEDAPKECEVFDCCHCPKIKAKYTEEEIKKITKATTIIL